MRLSRATKEISVGAFVSIGLILFAVGVMAISKEQRLFSRKSKYWTRFDNTSGLSAEGGADGVGRATTQTVVAASLAVLVSDFFLTKFFLAF